MSFKGKPDRDSRLGDPLCRHPRTALIVFCPPPPILPLNPCTHAHTHARYLPPTPHLPQPYPLPSAPVPIPLSLTLTPHPYILLSAADQLLASKKYKELLQSYTQRKGAAVDFMRAVHPSLLIESGALEDPKV